MSNDDDVLSCDLKRPCLHVHACRVEIPHELLVADIIVAGPLKADMVKPHFGLVSQFPSNTHSMLS